MVRFEADVANDLLSYSLQYRDTHIIQCVGTKSSVNSTYLSLSVYGTIASSLFEHYNFN